MGGISGVITIIFWELVPGSRNIISETQHASFMVVSDTI
jgi:hypothetical protein